MCKIDLLLSQGWMYLEGVEGSDVTTEQKPEQKGEEATVEAKIFRLGNVPRTTVCRKHLHSSKV